MSGVLSEVNNTSSMPKKSKSKALEDIYQKKTPLEHVLLRPDTYVGSVESITQQLLVHDGDKFVTREVTFVPGLYKIFDEIMVNAADNKQRDPTMDSIRVNIDKETSTISIFNTGKGIPVHVHSKEKMYIPELIFGNLLTSSNYDDNQKKVTGGRNGYGAKLCNIFSKEFIVETCDTENGLTYKQVFSDNMRKKKEPKIKPCKSSDKDFTRISFKPDLDKFGMTELDDDIIALMTRRVYDVAGTVRGIKVYLNGERIPVKSFRDYVQLLLRDNGVQTPVAHEVISDRWEVCMTTSDNGFQQMSFVNSIATTKGGTHVNYLADQIVSELLSIIKKKNKAVPVKPFQVKNHMWLFVNCLIENPSFDSQTKENMTRRPKDFGSSPKLSDKFLKDVKNSGIVNNILTWAKFKSQTELAKKSSGVKRSRLTGIPKLDDANEAGGRNSYKCTLILTEGDSAKALAISGLGVVGRDHYGVFPLRGKLLNVREASHKQISENSEIKNIVQIMGLKYNKQYDSVKELRYGRIMIMADQDQDGSHIKGLLINFLHHFWPSLLQLPDFLIEFVTPIVKCTKGKQEHCFFTLPQYEEFIKSQGSLRGWKVKYYKGLGTSTPAEAKQYFSDMAKHEIPFAYAGDDDFESIVMAFSKKHVEERKDWLRQFKPGTYLDHDVDSISYSDFINKELILFSMADNVRSIPNVMDGFKPGQRKVLFSCFKRKLSSEIKVAQLAGYVAEHSSYHHGENSLASTIVGMAQEFVGSNNLNLLMPIGQFGTRLQGGKDAASARYIFTNLSPLARLVYHINDDDLLKYLDDDGQQIEPEFYVPIIPMVLVNGSDGIGTGWSSFVPNFNPRDIIANLQRMLDGQEPEEMMPWYKGFKGEIDKKGPGKYVVRGAYRKLSDTEIEVYELPVRSWTQPYKEMLETMRDESTKGGASIVDYAQYHTDTTVRFVVRMTEEQMAEAEKVGIEKKFKLETSLSTCNMHLFDSQNRITKYEDANDILKEFFQVRLGLYQDRKAMLADRLTEDYEKLDNKVRFIKSVITGDLVISNKKRQVLMEELQSKGFKPFPKKAATKSTTAPVLAEGGTSESDAEEATSSGDISSGSYDYLLSMPMWNLTLEKVRKLEAERSETETRLSALLDMTPADLWREDLDALLEGLAEQDARDAALQEEIKSITVKKNTKGRRKPVKSKPIAMNLDDDDWEPSTSKGKKAAPTKRKNIAASASEPSNPLKLAKKSSSSKNAGTSSKANGNGTTSTKAISVSDSEDDIDEYVPSLSERLKSKPKATTTKATKKGRKAKIASTLSDDELEEEELSSLASKLLEEEGDSNGEAVNEPVQARTMPKRRAAAKKAIVDDDFDEDEDFEMSDAESEADDDKAFSISDASEDDADMSFVPEPKKPAVPRTKRLAAAVSPKKRSKKAAVESDEGEASSQLSKAAGKASNVADSFAFDSDDSDEPQAKKAKTTKSKPAKSKTTAVKTSKATTGSKAKTTTAKKAGGKKAKSPVQLEESFNIAGTDDVEVVGEDEVMSIASSEPTAKSKASKKTSAKASSAATTKSKTSGKSAAGKGKGKASKKKAVVEDDSFSVDDTDSDAEPVSLKDPTPRPARSRRQAAKKVKYTFSDDEDEDDGSDSDF